MREYMVSLMFLYYLFPRSRLSNAHVSLAPQVSDSDVESEVSDTVPYRAKEKREAAREDEDDSDEQPDLAADSNDDDDGDTEK
jgi:hypothetical protein